MAPMRVIQGRQPVEGRLSGEGGTWSIDVLRQSQDLRPLVIVRWTAPPSERVQRVSVLLKQRMGCHRGQRHFYTRQQIVPRDARSRRALSARRLAPCHARLAGSDTRESSGRSGGSAPVFLPAADSSELAGGAPLSGERHQAAAEGSRCGGAEQDPFEQGQQSPPFLRRQPITPATGAAVQPPQQSTLLRCCGGAPGDCPGQGLFR